MFVRVCIVLVALFTPLFGQEEAPTAEIGWLEGFWSGTLENGNRFEALYTRLEGGVIVGFSRETKGKTIVFHEYEVFETLDDVLHVTPYPNGNKSVSFRLRPSDSENRSVVFMNLYHDFPKELRYELTGEKQMSIKAIGKLDGKPTVLTFELTRISP